MSRSGLVEYDGDDALSYGRWRGMVASAIRGKRGQKFFRTMAEALDAMPEKILITEEIVNSEGNFCALGALGSYIGIEKLREIAPEDPVQVSQEFDISACLAQEVVWENDEVGKFKWIEVPYVQKDWWDTVPVKRVEETASERWTRMREWVQRNIHENQTS